METPDPKGLAIGDSPDNLAERKRAEEALRESEARFDQLAAQIGVVVWEVDAQGLFVHVSHVSESIWGYRPDEIVGRMHFYDLHPEAGREEFKKAAFAAFERKEPFRNLLNATETKDGRPVWVSMNGIPLLDADGTLQGYRGSDTDVTERKRAVEALREISARDEAILNEIPDIVMQVDANKVYTWANAVGLEFFGDDVIGREAAHYFVAEQNTYQHVQPLFDGDTATFYVESWQRRKDGQKRLLAWWCRALKDANGRVVGALSTARDITESRRVEEALRESEERFKCVFENSNAGKSITRLTGEVQVNRAVCNLLGYSAAELRDQRWQALTHPEDVEPTQRALDGLLVGEQDSVRLTKRYLHKNGSVVWADVSITLRRDQAGQPLYFMTTLVDISERKRAEEALRESEARFDQLAAQSGVVVWEMDAQGLYTHVSHVSEAIWGYRPDEIVGRMHFYDLHPEAGREEFKKATFAAFERREPFQNAVSATQTKDGRSVWVSTNGIPLLNPDGTLRGYRGSDTDVTEHKRVEGEAQSARAFLDRVINAIADPVFVKDEKRRFVLVNDALCAIVGRPRAGLLGEDGDDMFPKEQVVVFRKMDAGVLDTGEENVNEEHLSDLASGEVRTIVTRKTRYVDPAGKRFLVGVIRDITERKRAEETLLASEQKYRELVDNINDVIFTLDTKGIITYLSAPVLQVSGFAPSELIGRPFSEVVHADDLPDLEARVRDVLEGRLKAWDFRYRTKDGQVRWARTSSRPIVEGGRATGIRGVLSDVTGRKQTEAKMEAQNEELRRWQQATLGREGRVLELKKEVNELLAQAGQPPRYPSVLEEK